MTILNNLPSIFVPLVGLVFPAIAMASLSLHYELAIRTYMDRTYSGVSKNNYLDRNLISLFPSQEIIFFPQGIVMSFYGLAGLFISSYLWCTISWNVGSGYDRFDRKEGIVKNRRILLRFFMKDIQSIRIEVKEGFNARRRPGAIPLTRTDENLTPREIEQKAAELAYFLRVPIELTNEADSLKIHRRKNGKKSIHSPSISYVYSIFALVGLFFI
uniref:Photosystem I assembly protein Ycf4 n=1 Tax=Salix viminalis TaxID=40686 RepID=A0A6N2NIH9_SALVM